MYLKRRRKKPLPYQVSLLKYNITRENRVKFPDQKIPLVFKKKPTMHDGAPERRRKCWKCIFFLLLFITYYSAARPWCFLFLPSSPSHWLFWQKTYMPNLFFTYYFSLFTLLGIMSSLNVRKTQRPPSSMTSDRLCRVF